MTENSADDMYRKVFDSVLEGILIVDPKGIILEANPRLFEIFQYGPELIGQPLSVLIPERFHGAHKGHREQFMKKPTQRSMGKGMSLWGIKKDGQEFPVEISLNYFEKDGKKHALALLTDITERKKTDDAIVALNKELEEGVKARTIELDKAIVALQESQQLYSLIAKNFPSGMINVLDLEHKYVFVEGQDLVKYGLAGEQLIGTSYLDRHTSEDQEMLKSELVKVQSGVESAFELTLDNASYLMNAVPLYGSDGKVNQVLLVEHNNTEQKQAEKDMIHALQKERELNELKSRFVSMASHEFRTPLATILSSVSLISRYANNNDHEKADRHLERVRNSVQNLTSILNDFLSLEKLEKGLIECDPKEFDLIELAKNIKDEILLMAKKGQSINLVFEGAETVVLDPQMMRNIMLNLLSNAVKYSPEGSRIEFNIHVNDKVMLVVQDQGIGIPKADQKHLFERFFRAKNASSIQGTGLGLNIVKRYADLMEGSVKFDSKEALGTTFVLEFPRKLAMKPQNG